MSFVFIGSSPLRFETLKERVPRKMDVFSENPNKGIFLNEAPLEATL